MPASAAIVIWTAGLGRGDPGYGGWAYVKATGPVLTGVAGGDRRTSSDRMVLTAMAEGLASLSEAAPSTAVIVQTDHGLVVEQATKFLAHWRGLGAKGPPATPDEHRDLWERIALLARARPGPVAFSRLRNPSGEAGFVDAWAAFGRDKAKTSGAFSAPIPKNNLAKFPRADG
ncbi:MAG: ribonuclease, partial [Caulobacter sp.]|nr:ribonuclease [Caulobacter sp.]